MMTEMRVVTCWGWDMAGGRVKGTFLMVELFRF